MYTYAHQGVDHTSTQLPSDNGGISLSHWLLPCRWAHQFRVSLLSPTTPEMFAPLAYYALALATVLPCVLSDIIINGPNSQAYWVQFTENNITWSFSQGDPNPISIIVANTEQSLLNGAFSIAEYLDTSVRQFTVTNVTLVLGSDYVVNFVEPTNASHVYATSQAFEVKPHGTISANVISDTATSTESTSESATTTGADNSQGTAPPDNAASRITISSGVALLVLGCVIMLF